MKQNFAYSCQIQNALTHQDIIHIHGFLDDTTIHNIDVDININELK